MLVMKYLPKASLCSSLYKKYSIIFIKNTNENYIHTNVTNTSNNGKKSKDNRTPDLPDPPTNCCMSGCANCVWLKYAEELSKIFEGAEDKVKDIIISKIDDPNMKAFLLMELRAMKFKK